MKKTHVITDDQPKFTDQLLVGELDQNLGRRGFTYFSAALWGILLALVITAVVFWYADRLRDLYFALRAPQPAVPTVKFADAKQYEKEFRELQKSVAAQRKRLQDMTPQTNYLIINTSENRITMMRGKQVVHEGLCSTGSYTVLKTHDGLEKWVFQTPRGMLRVQNKIVDPVWRMPDWAFIEEGLPVPPPYAAERYEYNVLGDYALDLGNGYLIHGTLYQRFLGMPVTHGCVRLGDEELKIVFDNMNIGSKVFIY